MAAGTGVALRPAVELQEVLPSAMEQAVAWMAHQRRDAGEVERIKEVSGGLRLVCGYINVLEGG